MENLIEILSKLLPRKFWILGITLLIMIIGLIIKIPAIKNTEYEASTELFVISVPQYVRTDFNKYALRFVKKPYVVKALSKKFNVKDPQIDVSFGKNKSICFTAVNSNPKLADEMVKELISMFNQKINSIVNAATIASIEKTDYLIDSKQQQIDSVKQRLINLYEQNGITYVPNSYLSNFDRMNTTNSIAKMKPTHALAAEKGVDIFAEETMLFNCIFDLNQHLNRRSSIVLQLDIENNYLGILTESDSENPEKAFSIVKFLIGMFVLGLFLSISLFLFLDFGKPVLKSFRNKLLNKTV